MISLPTLSLVVAAAFTVPPADDDILEKIRKALLLRAEFDGTSAAFNGLGITSLDPQGQQE